AEVVAKQPLQDQPSGGRIERRKDQDDGLNNGMEDHVEQHENHKEHDGKNDLQTFLGSQFKLVLAGPRVVVPSRQCELLAKHLGGLIHKAAIIARVQI